MSHRRLYAACLFALESLLIGGRAARIPEPLGLSILAVPTSRQVDPRERGEVGPRRA